MTVTKKNIAKLVQFCTITNVKFNQTLKQVLIIKYILYFKTLSNKNIKTVTENYPAITNKLPY